MSGTTPGCSASGKAPPAAIIAAATRPPDPATSQARAPHRSGRYRVRTERRPPSLSPASAATSPATSSGSPYTAPCAASSPYVPAHTPSRPPRVSAFVVCRTAGGTWAVRPYPRASIDAARATERSSAPSSTGSPIWSTAATPPVGRPRSRRAVRSRTTSATMWGAKVIATTTATPTSYSAPGSDFSSRAGLASEFAAPTQISSVASFAPSYSAKTSCSAVTWPPIRTPCAQSGSGTSGSVKSGWVPGTDEPSRTEKTSRTPTTNSPSLTNAP